ncbi:MAG TPA: DUF3943 domain-containing protein [Vicinamibacterales bacterium]|nr:DUF3943 domain-containing protein [Vicinamibacterales bacterium]
MLASVAGAARAGQAGSAQDPAAPPPANSTGEQDQAFDWQAERRACEGCPRRGVGRALLQTTLINVLYETANLVRGQVTARITPKSWWENMSTGWVWDLDDFEVNQIGHPYQGSNYYNSGRANGLSFYESSAVTAFGSATWEYFGETNHPSLNDFINTTLGGIALGEMFHRAAWLVRDTRATGRGRLWREIGAMAIDPVTGYNRFRTGDAKRLTEKPADMVPSALSGLAAAGVLWRGSQTRAVNSTGQPFFEMDLLYGEPQTGRSRTPYDAFSVRLRFGGGSAFSEARVRGRLMGEPMGGGKTQLIVMQSYDYQRNDAYATGAQSIEAAVGVTQPLSTRTNMWFMGWGGLTVLGAVDSLPPGITEPPPQPEGPGAGQGVSEGPRYYDYGPGATFGALAQFTRNHRTFAMLMYEGRHLYSLDGIRANHFMQRARGDLLLPVRGALGLGASAELFFRQSFYQDEDESQLEYRYPQFRVYFTWSLQ